MAVVKHNPATMSQGAPATVSSAGEKVVVANKLPFALRLRTFKMVGVIEQRPNAPSKEIEMAEARPDTYLVSGTAEMRGPGRTSTKDGRRIMWGYALTDGVPKDVWEQWAEDNKDQPMVRNKLVFAMPSMADAEACARENEGRVTNLEPLNPDGDPRMQRNIVTATTRA